MLVDHLAAYNRACLRAPIAASVAPHGRERAAQQGGRARAVRGRELDAVGVARVVHHRQAEVHPAAERVHLHCQHQPHQRLVVQRTHATGRLHVSQALQGARVRMAQDTQSVCGNFAEAHGAQVAASAQQLVAARVLQDGARQGGVEVDVSLLSGDGGAVCKTAARASGESRCKIATFRSRRRVQTEARAVTSACSCGRHAILLMVQMCRRQRFGHRRLTCATAAHRYAIWPHVERRLPHHDISGREGHICEHAAPPTVLRQASRQPDAGIFEIDVTRTVSVVWRALHLSDLLVEAARPTHRRAGVLAESRTASARDKSTESSGSRIQHTCTCWLHARGHCEFSAMQREQLVAFNKAGVGLQAQCDGLAFLSLTRCAEHMLHAERL